MRLIAAGVCAAGLGGLAASATAQPIGAAGAGGTEPYPPLKWVATEELDAHPDAVDQAVDMAIWTTGSGPSFEARVYVTGWMTEIEDDEVVGTRIATYKYDAAHPGPGAPPTLASAHFPPPDDPLFLPLDEGEEFKAVAMAVDESNGDVYIAGHGPRGHSGQTTDANYVVLKYDQDLNLLWDNYYDGPVSEGDLAADIALGGSPADVVVVTGTSMGPADPPANTQQDIATFAWEAGGAIASTYWPDIGWGAGCRRFDAEGGDDIAVGIGHLQIETDSEEEPFLSVVVGGTAWREESERNFTVHRWYGPETGNDWATGYDNGGDDVMTAIWPGNPVYVAGYSESPTTGDYDFAVASYTWDVTGPWSVWPALRKDFNEQDDIPLDLVVYEGALCSFSRYTYHIWLTGATEAGSRLDVATVYYKWECQTGNPSEDWSESWSLGHDLSYGHAIAATGDEAYISGSIGENDAWDAVLALKYEREPPPDPLFVEDWWRPYHGGGALTRLAGPDHEGSSIIVKDVDPAPGEPSVFMAGVATVTGKSRQFTTWRFQED